MNRREQIRMSDDEVAQFLDGERVVTCATFGPRGWPHLMPLWFVVRDGQLWGWTFAKSQKAKNLLRDPRATLQVETGEQYDELRGVMLECDTIVYRDSGIVTELGLELMAKYTGGDPEAVRPVVQAQAAKRVALQFTERHRVSWDHRKLGGTY
jgi:hypothetical protein